MSSTDPFKLLGLKRASASEADVKAAYARLLKVTRPEDDRAAFMELRAAFSSARAIARGNDQRQESAPQEAPEKPVETAKKAAEPKPVSWVYHEALNWNCTDDATGILVKDTLDWMIAAGPNADAFAQNVAESLLSQSDIDDVIYRRELRHFLFNRSDPDGLADEINIWEEFDAERPEWLNQELMVVLYRDIQMFKTRPSDPWQARGYNVLLNMFQPAIEMADAGAQPIEPLDPASLFTNEQNKNREEEHGSYFDRDSMSWVDKSPVGLAMTDIQAAIDRGLWDLPQACRDIFNRDDLQPLDEFQELDRRMRNLVCAATGWNTQERKLSYPSWLSSKLVIVLDKTFGWSRHYGRNSWERQQFDWLHKVLERDIKPDESALSFKAAAAHVVRADPLEPLKSSRPPPIKDPGPLEKLARRLYHNPMELMIGYLGYRVLQVLIRLVF